MTPTPVRGTCALCGYSSTKAGLMRHLKTCSTAHDAKSGKPVRLFTLRIEDEYGGPWWLDLELQGRATLADLDAYLREVWLDPCGHLSTFEIACERYSGPYSPAALGGFNDLDDFGEKSMDTRAEEVLSPGLTFTHEYDFVSTTALKLKGEREGRIGRRSLRLLARNDAPAWTCRVCGEPATLVYTEEMYGDENPLYCEQHAADDEYLYLPVVNSPPMGVCGYTGPDNGAESLS